MHRVGFLFQKVSKGDFFLAKNKREDIVIQRFDWSGTSK
jgi:hypothetical protein